MYLRFLSMFGLVIFVLFSGDVYANTKAGYNFKPAQTNYYAAGPAARDLTACKADQPGKAVLPNNAAVGEKLCDTEATRRGIPVAHMKWVASPTYGTWSSPGDNSLCKMVNGSLQYVKGAGSAWTNIVICKYEPFDCGDRWSYTLDAGTGSNVNNWQLDWTKTSTARDYTNINGTRFVCMPRTCTTTTCPDTPANQRDECFLTDEPGEYRKLNGTLCACPASKEKVGNNCVANPVTPPVVPPVACNDSIDNDTDGLIDFPADPGCTSATDTSEDNAALAQCADRIDNDGDGKIDFVCPAGGTPYTPEQSKGRESASFTAAQGIFEDMAPSGQAKRPTLISSKVNPGDKVKIVSVSNNKFSISVGKGKSYERTCDYGSISFVNANERTLDSRQFRNINNNGIIAPPGTNRAFVSFDDNPQQYSDNSGYNGNNGYNPCQVTIEVFSPAIGTPGAAACTPDPDCSSATDNTEAPEVTQCSDGIDNDGDGKIDFGGVNPDPECTSATDDTESADLVCPAGQTRKPTPESPVCFLTATPTTSPAGTSFSLTGYSHLTGTCTLASATTHDTPPKTISPLVSLGLSVSASVSHITASTTSVFTTTNQLAGLLTCPQGTATCSIGTGGVISCGCYNAGITPPTIVTAAEYTCASNLCAEGQYFCSAENACKPAGQPCSTITCNKNNTCDVGESCNCSDCTQGNLLNDKDQCGLSLTGEQLYCTKDSINSTNTTFPFCLPACLDGQACTTTCKQQIGACCPAGSQWNSTSDSCVPTICGKGQFYCAAQKKCLPGGTTCDTAVCNNDGTCSGDESCQCADCVNGGDDDKDKCSIIGGIQAMCSDDNLADGKPGACCVPPEKWDSTANSGAGACTACSNTQAPAELKANYDQPYITCTGNGVVADTHFRYMIKQGTTVVMTSDIYPNSTQVLHPKMAAGTYTVQCFYGNATAVNTTGTATPHTCEKTMTVKDANENAVQGCNRVYAYKGSTLSDELTSNTSFDASFRCGARLTSVDSADPFALHLGTIAPQFLGVDTFMTSFLAEYQIGAISTQTQNHRFNTGSTPIACAVRVGGGYSTNDFCRATACVGDNCNVPQAFSVVHSGDAICTTEQTDTYNIGCNPDAPEDIRNACVAMFQSAVTAAGAGAANGTPFTFSFSFNGKPENVECAKYAAGDPELHNIYDTVSCQATLANGEYYDIYAADSNGNKINSLQTQTRTVQRDTDRPKLDPIRYYTDSSLTTPVTTETWSNKPIIAVAVCRDTPTTESASCACSQFVDDLTTNKPEWARGVYHGTVDIGADLLRYTRVISERIVDQDVVVVDTAQNTSTPVQKISANIDTEAPEMTVSSPGTAATRDVTLTVEDSISKIWKTTIAPTTTPATTNTQGIIWRRGLKANLSSLTFDEECGVTPSFATVSETGAASFPTTATVTIPAVNTANEVVTYCIRDNAGNTTRGIYPVVTDACFSATNMSPIPTFDNYKDLTNTRLGGSGTDNQKYGYSFSENTSNAACFRGILATNIQTFVANQLEPRTNNTLTNWDTDRAPTKANTGVLNTNGYYYYKYASNTSLNLTTSPTGTGTKTVIVDGGNIHIQENINYNGPGKTLLLIARRNAGGQGGDIIIDTSVTHIDAILIADGGAIKSSDASTPGERLTINGRIYSYNTRAGSLKTSGTDLVNADTPKVFTPNGALANAASLADAQKQDLERFRPSFVGESTCSLHLNYYGYTTATLPLLLQKPAGYQGGNCGF